MTRKIIFSIFILMKIISGTDAQNFIRITDATIPPPSSAELSKIEFAIQQAIDILPNADKPLFKVYDIGFYVHNDNINSGVSPIWEKIKTETESDPISDYYLIFGRESNNNRQDSKIRVKLKLPSTTAFNCLSNEERENIEKYIEQVANDKKNVGYINAELTSLDLLKDYLYKIIKCNCSSNGPNCSQFTNFSFLDLQLKGLGFRKKEIKVGGNSSWVNGTQEIYDYFGKKVFIDGVEYNIADQVSEGKAIIEAQIQVLPDTIINTSISGKVYILDNQSFTNGEWNNAKSEAALNDYVEYWVILTNSTGNSFLYSRFTVGGGLTPVAAKGEIGSRGIVAPPTPWGLALKAIGNAAIDAVMQTLVIRIVDTEVHDWGTAWNKVSYLGAAWEGVSSLIPWKKDLLSGVVRAATSAFAVVLDRALRIPDYTVNQGIVDFSIGFAASGITQLIAPKVGQYSFIAFKNGLSRLDKSVTIYKFKVIIKVVWNGFIKTIENSIPLSTLLTHFNHMIGNKGLEHIFRGEIKNGAVIGVHHISAIRSGTARIIPGSIVDLGNGFYKALVEVLDTNGNWILKQGESTFFPDIWPEDKVLQEISDIIGSQRAIEISRNTNSIRYQGTMSNGIKVIFSRWPSFNNNILTAFPEP